ncbi:unnamed protein product, partial [Scytosiphon promiscuus]
LKPRVLAIAEIASVATKSGRNHPKLLFTPARVAYKQTAERSLSLGRNFASFS